MLDKFVINDEYARLLIENSEFHKKVRRGNAKYGDNEFKTMQRALTKIELALSSKEIIQHAEHLFPQVGED